MSASNRSSTSDVIPLVSPEQDKDYSKFKGIELSEELKKDLIQAIRDRNAFKVDRILNIDRSILKPRKDIKLKNQPLLNEIESLNRDKSKNAGNIKFCINKNLEIINKSDAITKIYLGLSILASIGTIGLMMTSAPATMFIGALLVFAMIAMAVYEYNTHKTAEFIDKTFCNIEKEKREEKTERVTYYSSI